MKKSLSLLFGALLPSMFIALGACGDDVIDADAGDDDDTDASRQDATPIPPPKDATADARDSSKPDGDAKDVDVADADADSDGETSVPLTPPSTFVDALAAAYCTNYDGCCATDPSIPAANGTNSCLQSATTLGFFSGLLDAYNIHPQVAAGNKVRVDDALMTSCLAKVGTLGCINVEDNVPAAAWRGVLEDCSGALYGIGEADDACFSDVECGKAFSCRGATDAVAGKCTKLSILGETGSNTGSTYSDSCSYRGFSAEVQLHLDTSLTCQPLQGLGDPCLPGNADAYDGFDVNCESRACSLDAEDGTDTGFYCDNFKNDLYSCVYSIPAP